MESTRKYLETMIKNYINKKEISHRNELERVLCSEDAIVCFEFILYLMKNGGDFSAERSTELFIAASAYPIDSLKLSARAYKSLTNIYSAHRVITVADLLTKTDKDLMQYRNIGEKTIFEIKQKRKDFIEAWENGNLNIYEEE